jgi:hypothetical protein
MLSRVRVERGGGNAGIHISGMDTSGINKVTLRDSIVASSNLNGIHVKDDSSGSTTVMIERTAVVNNVASYAVLAQGAGTTVQIGESSITGNAVGLKTLSGGVIESYGDNKVRGNATDGSPTTVVAFK